MYNKLSKVPIILVIFMEAIIIFTAITNMLQNNMNILNKSLLAIISITTPFLISHIASKKKIQLPVNFKLVSILFIFAAQYFGEIHNFYTKIWWWDLLLHSIFGYYSVIIFVHIIKDIIKKEKDISYKRYNLLISLFAFNFSLTLGTLWEMFEFLGDLLFNTGMIKGGLEDTATDLLVKIAAAFLTSVFYYYKN